MSATSSTPIHDPAENINYLYRGRKQGVGLQIVGIIQLPCGRLSNELGVL